MILVYFKSNKWIITEFNLKIIIFVIYFFLAHYCWIIYKCELDSAEWGKLRKNQEPISYTSLCRSIQYKRFTLLFISPL
ncbi:hypothetical protein L3Y34_009571 [Caenorhabditis briggsae]|uniref:Uncharacterized protein n=1 Tax=Caenorhabditis briggsae TaxID=6238 RepID=A0AAE9A7J9_CAEBR|nr:hypothetical protein L3Y34_009571 [Caenorhabditis briggsae]